mmetsp:Transcript_38359/g.80295  ORF Transcript_38359/g.80295 Transcript_38359/m.80295 type:complete len:225 (-) Transcript_38359:75-749(-)
MSCTAVIFFPTLSTSKKSMSGRAMASGRPGNPPPVPTSHTRCPSDNVNKTPSPSFSLEDIRASGARLGRMCRPKTTSGEQSLREIRLMREFQSSTKTASLASCWNCSDDNPRFSRTIRFAVSDVGGIAKFIEDGREEASMPSSVAARAVIEGVLAAPVLVAGPKGIFCCWKADTLLLNSRDDCETKRNDSRIQHKVPILQPELLFCVPWDLRNVGMVVSVFRGG